MCSSDLQKIAYPGMRVLGLVPDTDVRLVEQCSAVDGTWGMKAKNYEMGRKYAQKLVREINETPEATVVTDCPLSGLRIQKETGRLPVHPIEALQHAYGLAPDDDRLAASSRTRSREGTP